MCRLSNGKVKWRPYTISYYIILINLLLFPSHNAQQQNQRFGGGGGGGGMPVAGRIAAMHTFVDQKELSMRLGKAKEMLEYMKPEANPCVDFYDFACGKYADYHNPQQAGEMITPQTELEAITNQALQQLLSKPHPQSTPTERKVLNFYQACTTVESTSPAQKMFMEKFVEQLGGLPSLPRTNFNSNYDWLRTVAELRANYGLDVLIGFEIGTNLETMRDNAIFLSEPKTTIIPPENCSAVAMESMRIRDEGYEVLQEQISEHMQRWMNMREADAKRFGGDVIRFEFELCKKMRIEQALPAEEMEGNENNEFPVTNSRRHQMKNNIGQNRLRGSPRVVGGLRRFGISQLDQFEQSLDLKRYVQQVLGTPYNEHVYIKSEQYLKHLARVIRGTNKMTIANYLMYRALAALNFPSDDSSQNRQAYCVQKVQTYFPKIIGAIYSRRFQRNENAQIVMEYFTEITKALDESLEADWITEQTRRAAHQKLAQFKARFPIYQNLELNDLQLEPMNYWERLVAVMRYNAREKNAVPETIEAFDVAAKLMPLNSEVMVAWALLQPPLFSEFFPRAMNYAFLGQRMARELALAFDEHGWRLSPISARQIDEFTMQTMVNQSECYRSQYSNYLYNNPDDFRNASFLREIIADSNGLNLAFKAYLNWLKMMNPHERAVLMRETMRTVDYTNTQLFFIHFAQTRCAVKFGEEAPLEFLPLDKHKPERYAVNGPLSNFAEFAREFGCSPGDEMHPDEKCGIF